jgi:transposase-like protein
MDFVDTVPAMECPKCKARLRVKAYMPATDTLPAVAGYWCDDCQKEATVEIDQHD